MLYNHSPLLMHVYVVIPRYSVFFYILFYMPQSPYTFGGHQTIRINGVWVEGWMDTCMEGGSGGKCIV